MTINRMFAIAIFVFFIHGCSEPAFVESITGTWDSYEIKGDQRMNPDNFQMQLVIKKDATVDITVISKINEKTRVQRGSGKIVGTYLFNDKAENEAGKLSLNNDILVVHDTKRNKEILFKKIQ